MSNNVALANMLDLLRSKLGTCIDSTIGMGDLPVELPNGSNKSKIIFKNAIHTPEMAFTLILISRLDKAGYLVTFNKGMCTVKHPKAQMIVTIPYTE